ncbi:NADH dehydrogenase subunit 5 (chloroplast) [Phaseolus vulgaris]|uniref:NAD(P)H-quinone oxidoreductase subunit 5, chloroplastic n=2 Tax=Phaseolus vulgaris TaxID=3885 RepID=NU5C_PHAVU|nr:NADH dehydrogenase subunit 5 [Phaseolus vulgaris]A4GGE3.1 RecName: Full=NAD(P)H-quinone oxidoreductase subunit 5, chloroplastic; AltName: Full=NAD(P)H dehydrogenase subunit 5; AltName: Full=NADH-plastoquinone oxidoreductase subunit 5 [Phaseolus vulgaris]ABH88125.1 NADH-plastoquinone oxidoreductase subunit 5 [Phaseolus vulgaris]ABW22821.1 NADH-plastoquinone oxidoreductase subunit 5 [Phaseolus vulgaris]
MEYTHQYSWIIPFIPFPVPMLIGVGLLLFPTATKKIRRIWAFPSILLLTIVMFFSLDLSIHQIQNSSIFQYVWSWTINNDISLEFGYLIDSLTSIMSILITTVGILVLIYSDNYMSHDQGYLRFFAYMTLFNISMLGLVTSSNLIQIYFFWELIGMCSYLLIGFWFTRPIAANACQKAFVTNRVGDFGLLLGILGIYWITGSLEFRDLFQIINNLISKNEMNLFFVTLFALLLFCGSVAKSAQFPLHVWLPDAMEGPTPISALIHAATMVAAGIFLVARLLPLFVLLPQIMNTIAFIGLITVILGATLAIAQKDIKKNLAYSTMSQLGYMMLALGMGSYRGALFHLITHAYSKALLFLGSGSIIHSMEALVGYSPAKSQNMVFMGGLTKHVPITKFFFLVGTLSLCGIPPFACFWSKDEILNDSRLYSPIVAIIACSAAALTAFYMFRIYLLVFEGYLNVHFLNFNGKKNSSFYSISLWGKKQVKLKIKNENFLLVLLKIKKNEITSFFIRKRYLHRVNQNIKNISRLFFGIMDFGMKKTACLYPNESNNTMQFSMLVLVLFTLFVGAIGISFSQGIDLDILSKLLIPFIDLLHKDSKNFVNYYEFFTNATFSLILTFWGIFIASFFYKSVYSYLKNLNLLNLFEKNFIKKKFSDHFQNIIYNWSYNHGYIDVFYEISFISSIRRLVKFNSFFDKKRIDGITNGIGITSFFLGEAIKNVGGGRISSYILLYILDILIFILIYINFVFIRY